MVFSHLYVGATVLITNQSMTDKAFWNFMKEQHATSFTGVPYSFEILNLMRFFRMDLPDLTLLTQGGGKMPRQLNLKFANTVVITGNVGLPLMDSQRVLPVWLIFHRNMRFQSVAV